VVNLAGATNSTVFLVWAPKAMSSFELYIRKHYEHFIAMNNKKTVKQFQVDLITNTYFNTA